MQFTAAVDEEGVRRIGLQDAQGDVRLQLLEEPFAQPTRRAWFTSHQDDAAYLPEHQRSSVLAQPGDWRVFIEDHVTNPTLHGSFDELLKRAVERGVEEVYVWSSDARDFLPLDPDRWRQR